MEEEETEGREGDGDDLAEVVEDEDDEDDEEGEGAATHGDSSGYFTLTGDEGEEEQGGEAEAEDRERPTLRLTSLLRHLPGADLLRESVLGSLSLLENVRERSQKRRSNRRESSFAEALEWQIGRLAVRNLTLTINGHQLSFKGTWELRGFLGSEKKLKHRLVHGGGPHQLGLFAKLVKDSSGRQFVNGVNHFTGKEQYHFGDVSKAAIGKIGSGVIKGGQKLGPPLLRGVKQGGRTLGSGVKMGGRTIGSGVIIGGKKIGQKIGPSVNQFTGKEHYHFGDVSKAAIGKIGSGVIKGGQKLGSGVKHGVSKGVSGITGKSEYRFGDLTRSAVRKLKRSSKRRARRRRAPTARLPGPPAGPPAAASHPTGPTTGPATGPATGPSTVPSTGTASGAKVTAAQRHPKARGRVMRRGRGRHARGGKK